MFRRIIIGVIFAVGCFGTIRTNAQSIEESCDIISNQILNKQYHSFSLSGDGYFSYVWTDQKGSETRIKIDLTQITISKDVSSDISKVWINCLDAANCIVEQGKVGEDEQYYAEYSKTYLPTKDTEGMNAVYLQLEYLLKLSNEIR
ncbi:MAG: hypothetical protein LBL74_08490 [Bacteroidales bacterium]|jgi:hypothetical protein|nr:hypothetical protein [Bacteroidales bacterium]